MTFFRYIFSTLIALAAVIFAIGNMQETQLFYSPLDPPVSLPLSVVTLSAMAIGFFFGGLFVWCVHGPFSRRADKKRAQVYGLIKENKKLQEENEIKKQVGAPLLPSK